MYKTAFYDWFFKKYDEWEFQMTFFYVEDTTIPYIIIRNGRSPLLLFEGYVTLLYLDVLCQIYEYILKVQFSISMYSLAFIVTLWMIYSILGIKLYQGIPSPIILHVSTLSPTKCEVVAHSFYKEVHLLPIYIPSIDVVKLA